MPGAGAGAATCIAPRPTACGRRRRPGYGVPRDLAGNHGAAFFAPLRSARSAEAGLSGYRASVAASEVTLITGERVEVEGSHQEVETSLLGAARGSLMELAWLTEAGSGRAIGLNPAHVVAVRPAES